MRLSPIRGAAMRLANNGRIARRMSGLEPVRLIAGDYVGGETLTEAVGTALGLVDKGLDVSLHPLEPTAATTQEAQRAADGALAAVEELGRRPALTGHAEVSLNMSALGLQLPADGPGTARRHAARICRAARNNGVLVTVDDEGSDAHPALLGVVRSLLEDFPDTGAVVQAARHDSLEQIGELAGEGRRIRLCKGAYTGSPSQMVVRPHDVDLRMAACLRALLRSPATAMIATHDPVFIAIAERLISDLDRSNVEFQMLHGIRPLEQRRLADIGHRVRVYLPWGREWYRYCMRQIVDRPANLWLFTRSLVGHR